MRLNQRGIITVDFIFAMVLILGLTSLLFVLSFTLSTASIVQYATFAAARNYAAGNIDLETQEKQAQIKYISIINSPTFKPLFTNGWFSVDSQISLGDHVEKIPALQAGVGTGNEFWGASTKFTAKILDFKVPFFGSTAPDSDGTGGGFSTIMASFLGREPTEKECAAVISARWTAIQGLGSGYGGAKGKYYAQMDNGC